MRCTIGIFYNIFLIKCAINNYAFPLPLFHFLTYESDRQAEIILNKIAEREWGDKITEKITIIEQPVEGKYNK